MKELMTDYERERVQLVEEFTLFWRRRFGRGFKTRLLKALSKPDS